MKPATGKQLRDRGMQLALDKAGYWQEFALAKLRNYCKRRLKRGANTFLTEDFRSVHARQPNWPQPTSPACWGALTTTAAKKGIIKPTRRFVAAKSVKTHSHPIRVWRVGQV